MGIDTSNYTTSVAVFCSDSCKVLKFGKLLPVKTGEVGIRQSDAVFHHVRQLPEVFANVFSGGDISISSVGVSEKPRNIEGSYMPCFTVGDSFAMSFSTINGIPLVKTSHQIGHILAGLYSAKKLELVNENFIAFHVSGGTTDCLFCSPSKENVLNIEEISTSNDLKAGQLIDRVGVKLGLSFPCGKEIERLALLSDKKISPKICVKEDGNCCLSGAENIIEKMISDGETPENISRFCLDFVEKTVGKMAEMALEKYKNLPILFVGGVMSNSIIRKNFERKFECFFAEPEFSCDNAVGVAVYSAIKGGVKSWEES